MKLLLKINRSFFFFLRTRYQIIHSHQINFQWKKSINVHQLSGDSIFLLNGDSTEKLLWRTFTGKNIIYFYQRFITTLK